jgi:16S rRNA (cytosine967-C5)-methyltransferase
LEEENQAVARQIEASVPGFSRVPVAELVGAATAARVASADGREMVLLPNRHDTDGFYAAAFRRVS